MQIVCRAPAKINLRLKVEGRRSDGYHLLSMLNATLDFGDELRMEVDNSGKLDFEIQYPTPSICAPLDELQNPDSNLAYRAALMFREAFGLTFGAKIILIKRIPVGAGLGGGSSDAAAVLRGLSVGFKDKLPPTHTDKISSLAAKLGADVPFFLGSGFSIVKGIGEKLTDLDAKILDGQEVYLYLPKLHVPTARIFEIHRQAQRQSGEDRLLSPERATDYTALIENDLEYSLKEFSSELVEALERLRDVRGIKAGLSGSGAAFFAIPEIFGAQAPVLTIGNVQIEPYKTSFLPIPTTIVN